MVNFNSIFETEEILLRPIKQEDLEPFYKLSAKKEMWKFFTADLSDKNTLSGWIEQGIRDMKNNTRLALTIIDKRSMVPAGSTSLGNISFIDKRIEIGWTWIGNKYQGKGINDRSKYLLLHYCFEDLDFERVEFKTDVLNIHARNALTRIGAKEEGILRSHSLMTNARRRDTIYYSILKPEWPGIK